VRVDAAFTPSKGRTAPLGIVVDVLRATSTIAQALATGYRRVLCCSEIEEARALRAEVGDAIVGGERTAVRIPGFDAGASPREFLERAQSLQPSGIAERTSRCFARASRARSRSTMRTAPGGSSLPSTAHRALRFGNRSCDPRRCVRRPARGAERPHVRLGRGSRRTSRGAPARASWTWCLAS
jgi:hypothetical protein